MQQQELEKKLRRERRQKELTPEVQQLLRIIERQTEQQVGEKIDALFFMTTREREK